MELKLNHTYSRQEISKMLGGSTQAYLPYKDGKVVCGCFNTIKTLNPDAPEEVLFGRERELPIVEKTAEMVYQQGLSIPIFLFRGAAEWEYVGNYRCVDLLRTPALLKEGMQMYPRRGAITGVLRFEKA